MTPQKLAAYQTKLLAMRAALQTQISEQRGGAESRAEAAADRFGQPEDSRAQTNTERELEFALSDREAEELVAIDAALNRVENASFGECIDCGVQIPAARLDVSPEVTRCIACQEKVEQQLAS
ncbi:MAG: TraR/DksA family transcriptional regulator [Polaromonas sp.]